MGVISCFSYFQSVFKILLKAEFRSAYRNYRKFIVPYPAQEWRISYSSMPSAQFVCKIFVRYIGTWNRHLWQSLWWQQLQHIPYSLCTPPSSHPPDTCQCFSSVLRQQHFIFPKSWSTFTMSDDIISSKKERSCCITSYIYQGSRCKR